MASDRKTLQLRELLASVSLFKECDKQMLDDIAQSLDIQKFARQEVVFSKGDQMQALYVIEQGKVKAHDGDYLFAEFGPHDFFGEYSLIDDSIRSASVTALEATTVLVLNKEKFDQLLERNSRVARSIMVTLIGRLRNFNVHEEQLAQKSQELAREKEGLEKERAELEKLNATKDKFFSLIAHDLKNPFNTIIGLSELVLQRFDSYSGKKIKEFVRQIYNYSTHTYTLLDNMLQWARSQTRQIKVHRENIDLQTIIHDNINLLQNKADEKNLQLETDIRKDAVYVYADENMTGTVVRNLISNAIKFTGEKGLVVVRAQRNDPHNVLISVVDNGMGIPKENLEKIFDLDAGYSTQGTRSEKGTGLGLILCKEFVQMNHGKIWVESEVNKGSAFHVLLPAASEMEKENTKE
jgi:signal transduction histidine kinase